MLGPHRVPMYAIHKTLRLLALFAWDWSVPANRPKGPPPKDPWSFAWQRKISQGQAGTENEQTRGGDEEPTKQTNHTRQTITSSRLAADLRNSAELVHLRSFSPTEQQRETEPKQAISQDVMVHQGQPKKLKNPLASSRCHDANFCCCWKSRQIHTSCLKGSVETPNMAFNCFHCMLLGLSAQANGFSSRPHRYILNSARTNCCIYLWKFFPTF